MATYRKTQVLSNIDAAYIAGLIDGEGTITLGRKHRRDNRQLVISISSNELELLQYVLTVSGVGKITNKKTYSHKHAPSYAYAVTNRQALQLLEQVHVYLKSYKARRSRLILDQYLTLTPRNGKYTPELTEQRKIFEDRLLGIKPV